MSRVFWLLVGAVLGVLGVRRAQAAVATVATPRMGRSLGTVLTGLGELLRRLGDRVRTEAARREQAAATALDLPEQDVSGDERAHP